MMWLVTLLILAIIAYFVVKSVSSNILRKQAASDTPEDKLDHAPTQQPSLARSSSANTSSSTQLSANGGISTGNTLSDVREMIKILNLDAPDAGRLAIEREQLVALRKGKSEGIPDAQGLEELASRLRNMLS